MQQLITSSITQDVAQFIVDTTYDAISKDVETIIKHAFIDTIGVAFAGRDEECVTITRAYAKTEGAKYGARIWGRHDEQTSVTMAALVNGTMAHALDFDDLNAKATHAHPSASLVPAILAVAEQQQASGQAMIRAYFIGLEVMGYIGRLITYDHYEKGWHGTATIGTLGCMAAAASLYGLSVTQVQHAIGIAVSSVSGTRQNFGTMTKPYHAGKAAQAGITAAQLAQAGFTASMTALEAPLGFFQLYGKNKPVLTTALGTRTELQETKLTLKKYPCCYGSHRAIDAMSAILQTKPIELDTIENITVTGPLNAFTPLIHRRPQTGLEGKFSLEFPLALRLLGEVITIQSFVDDTVQRADIQQLMAKIERYEDPTIPITTSAIDEGYVEVAIQLIDGTVIREQIEHPKGSVEQPLSHAEIAEKFLACVQPTLNKQQAQTFLLTLEQLETLPTCAPLQAFL